MATPQQISTARGDTQLRVLEFIRDNASGVANESTAAMILNMAEAFAWLSATNQPHGGRSTG